MTSDVYDIPIPSTHSIWRNTMEAMETASYGRSGDVARGGYIFPFPFIDQMRYVKRVEVWREASKDDTVPSTVHLSEEGLCAYDFGGRVVRCQSQALRPCATVGI